MKEVPKAMKAMGVALVSKESTVMIEEKEKPSNSTVIAMDKRKILKSLGILNIFFVLLRKTVENVGNF